MTHFRRTAMGSLHYSPADWLPNGQSAPENMAEFEEWLTEKTEQCVTEIDTVEPSPLQSRIYIVVSIRYKNDRGLTQIGNAPGFFGGLWTLATCKKKMRKERKFKKLFTESEDGIRRPKVPLVILGCASRNQNYPKPDWAETHRNWLAYAAIVTHGFDTMEAYNRHLTSNYSGETIRHRRTHASDATDLARDRGDLHVDEHGNVKYPPVGHQHGPDPPESEARGTASCGCRKPTYSEQLDPYDHNDNHTDHVKCLSSPGMWTAWREPRFAVKPQREFYRNNPDPTGIDEILDWFMETKPIEAPA